MGIRFLLIQNLQGMTRLSKWFFSGVDDVEKRRVESEIHRLVAYRPDDSTNFLSYNLGDRGVKLVHRRYAGLVFTLCIDPPDNELAALESIHLFVELLDAYFKNVCELDIVFNFASLYRIVDEVFLAGELQETDKDVILERLREIEKLD